MDHWIFVVKTHKTEDGVLEGEEILRTRLSDKFWGLSKGTPNRSSLKEGDSVVFYVGVPKKYFAATAVLASESFEPSEQERENLSHGKAFYRAEHGVRLRDIEVWADPRRAEDLVGHLRFIENKEAWGTYLQGGIRGLQEEDFLKIVAGVVTHQFPTSALEEESAFALEAHLEEFIDKNWRKIEFGAQLDRFKTEDQDGRQFPAGAWSIDFLCVDRRTNELVVIELKRGRSSDSAVGQALRYINWVKENIAKREQGVRAIIITRQVDDALCYAVKGLNNITVLTYKVDFSLSPVRT